MTDTERATEAEFARAFCAEWLRACTSGDFLFAGTCTCEVVQKNRIILINLQPVSECPVCRRRCQLTPLVMYRGGTTWESLERNSEGRYIVHTHDISVVEN